MSKPSSGFIIYKRLLSLARKYWFIFFLGILGTVLLSLVDAGLSWLIKPIVNRGFIDRDKTFVAWLPLGVIIIFLIRGLAGFMSSYYIQRVSKNIVMDFRQRIFNHLLSLPGAFFDEQSSSKLLSTLIYNVEQVATATADALLTLLREGFLVIGLIGVMFLISWQLTLICLLSAPVVAWVIQYTSRRLRKTSEVIQYAIANITHIAMEAIDGYKVLRIFGAESYERQRFIEAIQQHRQYEMKAVVANSLGGSLVQVLIAIPIAVMIYLATLNSMAVSAGSFIAILVAMIRLLQPMRRLNQVNAMLQRGLTAADSVFKLLDLPVELDLGTRSLLRAKGCITYEKVGFTYPKGSQAVLNDISFTVKPGQTIALVGRSGSGKSTLINLLPRFYEVTRGRILLDDYNICDYRLADLRQQFAFVSQHIVLFHDSIANNIAYGQAKIHRDKIVAAAEAAQVMEFARGLPNGIDTNMGSDGLLLSGGQRQRIAIARAILKDAPILILDEATSALDSQSEHFIQKALEVLMRERSTFVVAHRLSTIEKSDMILVMDNGCIVESGHHQELLKKGGKYAELYALQYGQSS